MTVQQCDAPTFGRICGRAAALLERDGHTKGDWERPNKSRCLIGAINVARGAKPDATMPKAMAAAVHQQLFRTNGRYRNHAATFGKVRDLSDANRRIWSWNDLEETTANEVTQLLLNLEKALVPGHTPKHARPDATDIIVAQNMADIDAELAALTAEGSPALAHC